MTETQTSECAPMTPGPEHSMLEPFVGTFKSEVKMWMGPGEPQVSTGTMTNTMVLGGRFLQQNYAGDTGAGPFPDFKGHGYWGYNTIDKKFEGFWVDTACTFMQTESGSVDASGKVWTMVGEMTSPMGGTMQKRSVVTLQDDDHHAMEMFFQGPDGNESKGMEIRYTRVS